jgi:hypothetical protein
MCFEFGCELEAGAIDSLSRKKYRREALERKGREIYGGRRA